MAQVKTIHVTGTVTEQALAGGGAVPARYGSPGRGVAFASIVLTAAPPSNVVIHENTDASGHFDFTIPAGTYTLQVLSPSHQAKTVTVSRDVNLPITVARSSI
jgi:hypothetical protein